MEPAVSSWPWQHCRRSRKESIVEGEFGSALLALVFLGVPIGGFLLLFLKWALSGGPDDVSGYGHD